MSTMPTTVVRVSGLEVSAAGADHPIVHVHVSHESWLHYLVKALRAVRLDQVKAWLAPGPGPARSCCVREMKALGVAQIVLGVMCVALGVALRFGPYTTVIWLQSPFWTGALFVGLGALCVLCRRHGTGCLLFLTACLALASVVGATVAVVCGGIEVVWSRGNTGTRCSKFSFDGSYTDGWTWWECQEVLQMKNLFLGIRVLLLVTTASALVIAACCLVCTCQILCCRTQDQAESAAGAEPLVISAPTAQAQPQPDKETCVDSA
ncbi:transmembrane protein 176B isoform X1 [Alligator mississippiensis]|uniref:transmembrane protein 176B isoform X1 n=1 Tax=Alligator mississippiensis TaxID=8496 RepID=UPI002877AEA4|nr:transmembrane protein 176B isoform X1 [Alligator mississippiensis]